MLRLQTECPCRSQISQKRQLGPPLETIDIIVIPIFPSDIYIYNYTRFPIVYCWYHSNIPYCVQESFRVTSLSRSATGREFRLQKSRSLSETASIFVHWPRRGRKHGVDDGKCWWRVACMKQNSPSTFWSQGNLDFGGRCLHKYNALIHNRFSIIEMYHDISWLNI